MVFPVLVLPAVVYLEDAMFDFLEYRIWYPLIAFWFVLLAFDHDTVKALLAFFTLRDFTAYLEYPANVLIFFFILHTAQ